METQAQQLFMTRLLVIGAAGLAALLAYLFTPFVGELAKRVGAVDRPSHRKIHERIIPRWGGVAIVVALLGAVCFAWWVASLLGVSLVSTPAAKRAFFGVLLGTFMVAVAGALDDIYDLSPALQIAGQGIAATAALFLGVRIEFISNPFAADGSVLFLGDLGAFITVFWIIGITKAVDLIDGMDGLAAGIAAIAAATIALMAVSAHQPQVALIAAALAGGAIGFLRHNFNPAKIFMGTVGAYVLGFVLATSSIIGVLKIPVLIAMVVPILALGVPIFDTSFAIVRRARERRPIFAADKGHLHHRLLNRGLSQRQTVLVLYGVTVVLCAVALAIFHYTVG
ncbi:MAG TPA: MraY family glycosyltransferase [Armatimonadota bacterium]|jgi:UDP-GlcNAc:undecaprenyl-phosphate GlcNAc-1-phosphate transferase|nr:undecaprenyl/decaprenyl-phosphate alpha-N-acetylglucosaminyl 1-phosphate transferase [Armatimonadota bacterium]HOJ20846.1 MraY family glycosyltransferase [Armatimonadota bacterium]HOM80816.1 MraY family glycosyltransferase [Armatimonadota bacterium]HOQ30668.1 MraY family glycosyltransferase [Armatimonadota bacterium]HPO72416.1 MraY family glycosyltransferase [Armatimonadota bacterium]